MKKPYIINYAEEYYLKKVPVLYYDNETQINYIDEQKNIKALRIGPETTIMTETTENIDPDEMYFGPETTRQTATIENSDENEYFIGPDTTKRTFTIESEDRDEVYLGPDTTRLTKTIENSDPDESIIM
ncbi:hypothetical protein [Geobacillus sp. E263]|jgi:hypothetical protein|nr:hypothetical protein [Geobacillus sp. E263]AKM17552.1 hypothetical protein GARCT_00203 [Geobacillus sp. 12AMOR1]WJQ14242.1 hypothetical protein QT238_00995 [Geobacillus stearothermophilus]STO35729.1 Uncharacterised protein [[Flavobacterium] thermophilum]